MSLHGLLMAIPGMTLGLPMLFATAVILVIRAVGIPAFSISFTMVAPQRVQLPHVATRIAAWMPSILSCSTISRPIFLASFKIVRFPVVT